MKRVVMTIVVLVLVITPFLAFADGTLITPQVTITSSSTISENSSSSTYSNVNGTITSTKDWSYAKSTTNGATTVAKNGNGNVTCSGGTCTGSVTNCSASGGCHTTTINHPQK